ncbi:hypothetical protein [Streptomyces sp. JB150]|uniref:hypothetical protein n=1 Tax=Streptomyces sp. JB150 TaxID=2714844 RepID=UPI00140CC9A8|nr:hypothetical protein [Streptomyces sp. JB150]QIJ61439.1 hypothetical protein G7Z13_04855 [Streptomyces sp. JB150]
MTDRHHLDLCPDCGGLRVIELTSIGTVDITLDGHTAPVELWIGPAAGPCHVKATALPVTLAREIAREWWLITPPEQPEKTPTQRAIDILGPHLAWDHRYRP